MTDPKRPDQPSRPLVPYQRWLADLKRRKVFRVIAVYGAVAFVVMEVADLVFPAIPLPDWTVTLVLWLVLLGFPIALVLAWAFELTPDGVRLTPTARPEEIASIVGAPATSRWPPGLLALGGLILLAVAFYGGRRSAPQDEVAGAPTEGRAAPTEIGYTDPAVDPRPAIAVLPFQDMSPDKDQEYFSDGISEEILTALSRVRELRVAARSSAFTYKGGDLDIVQIARELGVPYVLGGSVRKDGDQIRISAELAGADGFRVWSQTYQRELEGVFAIQSEIAQAIADSLRIPLGLSKEALVSPTLNMDAHDLYLNARAAYRRRGPGVAQAIDLFHAAIAADSAWAPAWAGLAEALTTYPLYGLPTGESTDSSVWAVSLEAGEAAARRALELDPRSASAHVALGVAHRDQWQWEDAERELLQAIVLDPDSEEAHVQYAELLWGVGRLGDSNRESGRALVLDRTPLTLDVHAFTLLMNGRPDEAEPLLEEGLLMDPAGDMHFLRTVLASIMLLDGRYRQAIARFSEFLPDTIAFRQIGQALEAGDPSILPRRDTRGLVQSLVRLGEPERALEVLEQAIFRMPFRVQFDVWHPELFPIQGDPRFQQVILPRLGLEGVVPSYTGGTEGP